MLYKCTESFLVDLCDDDGFIIENEHIEVEKGSIWIADGRSYESINHIRLDRYEDKKLQWLEVPKEYVEEYFEPVICSYCKKDIDENNKFTKLLIEDEWHCFHEECDNVPLDHLLEVAVGNSK